MTFQSWRASVDILLKEIHAEKMQAAIQVHPPVREAGGVVNAAAGHLPFHTTLAGRGKNLRRQQLQKGLDGVKGAGGRSVVDNDALRLHAKFVGLFRKAGIHEIHGSRLVLLPGK